MTRIRKVHKLRRKGDWQTFCGIWIDEKTATVRKWTGDKVTCTRCLGKKATEKFYERKIVHLGMDKSTGTACGLSYYIHEDHDRQVRGFNRPPTTFKVVSFQCKSQVTCNHCRRHIPNINARIRKRKEMGAV